MPNALTPALTPAARLRQARRQLQETGELGDGLLAPQLRESWQRSLRFGLAPSGRPTGAPHASAAQLARAIEQRHALVAHAGPVMQFICEQIRDTDSLVILADPQGMLLHSLGDARFADKASRVALRPGAIWHEQWRGTNAIGTALACGSAVVIQGGEHYLERNGFLTCAAAPIVGPTGQLLGVLDISGDHRQLQRHTLGLARSASRMIEHRLFEAQHGHGLQLRLHTQPEGLGTVGEGLLALSEDGWITGANRTALDLLGLPATAIASTRLEQVLGVDWTSLLGMGARHRVPRAIHRQDGSVLWVRFEAGRQALSAGSTTVAPVSTAPGGIASPPRPAHTHRDALASLDTGDAAMQALIGRARRVLDKPIALLLQGESGVGKEIFAKACHASGPRRSAAFVAVNCAAIPESLIEAELFGYRPGAFTGACRDGAPGRIREAHGGTLFLDEIGDMPLAMQARLLRVLQERQVVPLGGGKPVAVDFQLICATHRRLRDEVEAGRFREDLYYRLNGLTLQLPPLRERSDLDALVHAMLREIEPARDMALSPELARAFAQHRWPGNLRQLANALRTACALIADDEPLIGWAHLPDDLSEDLNRPQAHPPTAPDEALDLRAQAGQVVQHTVALCEGNLSEAARRLGISRNTLYRKLRAGVTDAAPPTAH